jgi:hypothetical protein
MGSMNCVNGDELRIILSIQNNNECVTIRDACVLYSDLKEMIDQFDCEKELVDEKDVNERAWHVFCFKSILLATSIVGYAWLAHSLHGLSNP